jgi:hypothetical protein
MTKKCRFIIEEYSKKIKKFIGYLIGNCPFCDSDLTIFARDNPFDILKCEKYGLLYIDSLTHELIVGKTLFEKPIHKNHVKGVFVSNDRTFKQWYSRTPNSDIGSETLGSALLDNLAEFFGE